MTCRFDWHRLLPRYWLQLYPTDRFWSDRLSQAIDKGPVILEAPGIAAVGGYLVSIKHWPYGYGRPIWSGHDALPTVAVRQKLRRAIEQQRAAQDVRKGGRS